MEVRDKVTKEGTDQVGTVTAFYPEDPDSVRVSWPQDGYRKERIKDLKKVG